MSLRVVSAVRFPTTGISLKMTVEEKPGLIGRFIFKKKLREIEVGKLNNHWVDYKTRERVRSDFGRRLSQLYRQMCQT